MQPMHPDEIDPTGELSARLKAQEVEYGTYRAKTLIYAGLSPAYNVGAAVPVSNVVKHGYWGNGQVELVDGAVHAPEIAEQIARQAADDNAKAGPQDTPDEAKAQDGDEGPHTDV